MNDTGIKHDEAVFILEPPGHDYPRAVLIGPCTADPYALQREFIRAAEVNDAILNNARFDKDSFDIVVAWLTETHGFRSVPWSEWYV